MSELNQTPSEEATLLARGYKLTSKLGEGSYAKVFLAEYKSNDELEKNNTLACKIVDTSKAPKEFVHKFLPQNGDLLDFILHSGSVAESQARIWFRQLALGLQYLHEMEIAHRDMKCENVLLTLNYNVKLADFGFARHMVDTRGRRVLSDTYCGSLSYVAPEVLHGAPYNPKVSDIWSLGVILYIILNKAMPFDDTNLKRLYEQQTSRRWKFRSKVASSLSDNVKKLMSHILEPDITRRWCLDHIIRSDWIAMDPRLLILTPAEQSALDRAMEERKKYKEKYSKKEASRDESVEVLDVKGKNKSKFAVLDNWQPTEEVTVLKETVKAAAPSIMAGSTYFKKQSV
ncbi:hypothetical protein KM043_013854 [Ampulex compressa]|nr:hypothetical protein KM043_013854 [Ampulex compressa]